MSKRKWDDIRTPVTKSYICGYCHKNVASDKGWISTVGGVSNVHAYIYICPNCSAPTFIDSDNTQVPGPLYGSSVENIPDSAVAKLYNEARSSYASNSFTSSVLTCRKLLMHISVSKGASTGKSFIEYVTYLFDNNYIPRDAKDWVDHIRKKGNEANHEIVIMSMEEAEELISFCEMLLKIIYEFPAAIKKRTIVKK